jgi:hypothetical protein
MMVPIIHGYEEEKMPRRVRTVELQDIVQRLRHGHSVKAIHRETGRHRTLIRAMRDLAAREDWLTMSKRGYSLHATWHAMLTHGRWQ